MAIQIKPVVGTRSIRRSFSAPASFGLLPRVGCLAALFALEVIAICFGFDSDLRYDDPFRHIGAGILRGVVAFSVLLASLGYAKARGPLRKISARTRGTPVKPGLLMAHFCAMGAFTLLSSRLFPHHQPDLQAILLAVAWFAVGMVAIAFAASAFIPLKVWWAAFRATGNVWVYALFAGMLASLLGSASQFLWEPATQVTFDMVRAVLGLFTTGITSDATTRTIGTQNFMLEIDQRCSGLEGAGLMIVMGALWLGAFRQEFRFPRALLIIPAGVAVLYLLNTVRIAALILIGSAGAPEIAVHGFHSQAGWIAFNLVALGFSVGARKVPWFGAPGGLASLESGVVSETETPVTRWILPLMTILAAGMVSAAMSGDFEWLYPVRFFAATITLAFLWRRYRDLDWRVGWLAPAVGGLVFLIWIGLDRFSSTSPEAMPAPLAAASPLVRNLWLVFRVLAATVTVPVAEELAFRGFLYRRFLSQDFDSVSFQRFSWVALLASSAIFGLLHGDRWFVGAVAGALYTLVLIRRGRIGDAVAAHATTNALLAVDVLAFNHWHLW
jgi:exosortase E/protease (VPEID-CTERM system)